MGPWRAHHIREGEPYEVSNGHLLYCLHNDGPRSRAHSAAAGVLSAAAPHPYCALLDAGFTWSRGRYLRAPNLAVGSVDSEDPGWVVIPPQLALEYTDDRKDEHYLPCKLAELFELGTRLIWVVHLTGPLRVEIHEPGTPPRIVEADDMLAAPGILAGAFPVRALIDPEVARKAVLHFLLAKKGYPSLEAVREEGRQQGLAEARHEIRVAQGRTLLRSQLAARGWTLPTPLDARITACTDLPTLMRWLIQVAVAADVEAALR